MALVDAHYKLPPLEFPQRSDTAKEAFLRAFPQASLKFRGAFALAKLRAYDLTRTVLVGASAQSAGGSNNLVAIGSGQATDPKG